jgi:hypothetical protein
VTAARSAVLVFAALVLGSTPASAFSVCQKHLDCRAGLICIRESCTPCSDAVPCPTGECADGACVDLIRESCAAYPEPSYQCRRCESTSACQTEERCDDGLCLPRTKGGCAACRFGERNGSGWSALAACGLGALLLYRRRLRGNRCRGRRPCRSAGRRRRRDRRTCTSRRRCRNRPPATRCGSCPSRRARPGSAGSPRSGSCR